jgi:hypothetical protein
MSSAIKKDPCGPFLLFFLETEVLDVNRLLLCNTALHGRLLKILAGAHLADGTGLLELPLELLKGAFDILAFFNLYDDHSLYHPLFLLKLERKDKYFFYFCMINDKKIMKKVFLLFAALSIAVSALATVPHKAKIPDIPGYMTLKGDFHIHTCFSDGAVWPVTRVDEADYDGLDFISMTDHMETHHQHMVKDFGAKVDRNSSYEMASKAAKKYGILVIHGAELTRGLRIFPGHFNTHFISDAEPIVAAAEAHNDKYGKDETKQEEMAIRAGLKEARAQNAFVTWNHPDWEQQARNETLWWPIHTELLDGGLIQGIEIYNDYIGYDADAFHWAIQKNLTITTGTDAHKPMFQMVDYEKGDYRPMTLVFARERSLDGIREAVDNRRTVAVADGCVYGREELVRQLFDACIQISDIKYSEKKVSFTIRNISTIPVDLVKAPGSENLTYPRHYNINAEETGSIGVNGPDSRKPIGINEFDVHFKVTNWLVDADTPLEVSYHFSLPAKYRK